MPNQLTWWWLSVALIVVLLVVAALAWWRSGHGRAETQSVLVANTSRLTVLGAYREALKRQSWHVAALGALVAIIALPLVLAAGRPATGEVVDPEKNKRDIMLCLDVSGSMYATDEAILRNFAEIVQSFEGERIGLVLFNNQAVTAFPLTDDYDLVSEQLEGYASGFGLFGGGDREYDPFSGTFNDRIIASSLVPDGIASCVNNFDNLADERPRALVLGTDNEVHGSGVYQMDESVALAQEHNVRVYALNPMPQGRNAVALSDATEQTGGRTWALDDRSATENVTKEIERLEAARLPNSAPVYVRTDRPAVPMTLAGLALLAYFPLAWWWRR